MYSGVVVYTDELSDFHTDEHFYTEELFSRICIDFHIKTSLYNVPLVWNVKG